jgi:hypothetical protein
MRGPMINPAGPRSGNWRWHAKAIDFSHHFFYFILRVKLKYGSRYFRIG